MKAIFPFLLLLGFCFSLRAQIPYDAEKKKAGYIEVVTVPGATPAKLWQRANVTLPKMYNEWEKKVIAKNETEGTISLKCSTRIFLMDTKSKTKVQQPWVIYKLHLAVKDGRYRYEFSDFHRDKGGYKEPLEKWILKDDPKIDYEALQTDEMMKQVTDDIEKLIATLKAGMASDEVKVKEDW